MFRNMFLKKLTSITVQAPEGKGDWGGANCNVQTALYKTEGSRTEHNIIKIPIHCQSRKDPSVVSSIIFYFLFYPLTFSLPNLTSL